MIKESGIDELSISLNGLRISHLLACHQVDLSIKSETTENHTKDPTDLNKAVRMAKKERMDAFSSKIIHAQTKTMFLGSNMYVMMQALRERNASCLPHRLRVMKGHEYLY